MARFGLSPVQILVRLICFKHKTICQHAMACT